MTTRPESWRRRGTPISAGLGADLQTLGSLLANHTRGLDAYLQRQASRVEQRHQGILTDAEGFLLPPDLNLDAMTIGELQNLCRFRNLRGWSRLRRDDLLRFVKQKIGREIEMANLLHRVPVGQAGSLESIEPPVVLETDCAGPSACPAGASRIERLLLLLLQHLNVPLEQIQAAWQEPDGA